ncbi:minor tail protein [Arthrobacter phage Lewando]|nr:minor tail protein [Arthrobacter phage Lewando]
MAFTPTDPNKAEVRITGTPPNYGLDFYIPRGERGEIGPQGPIGPTNPTNLTVGVVETGPETAGATGPQGLKGDKGDPGGIVLGTSLGTADLNTILSAGVYRQGSSVPANCNYPTAELGVLVVQQPSANPWLIQEYQPAGGIAGKQGQAFYRRTYVGTTWSSWKAYNASRVDQTAGRVIYEWDDLNQREQLTYGDTGWRLLTPQNGWTASQVQLRRVGQTVHLLALQINGSAATTDAVTEVLPIGFRANNWPISLRVPITTGTGVITTNVAAVDISTQTLRIFGGSYTALTAHHVITSWVTNDAWPTTLPGTASGSIPNT